MGHATVDSMVPERRSTLQSACGFGFPPFYISMVPPCRGQQLLSTYVFYYHHRYSIALGTGSFYGNGQILGLDMG